MAHLIKDTLAGILDSYKDPRFKLLKDWHACLGPLGHHMRLERIYNDVLVLGVYDRMWMNELYMLSQTIITSINQALGGNYVHHIQLRLVNRNESSTSKITPRASCTPSPKAPTYQLSIREKNALDRITDPQLRCSLQTILVKISESAHGT